MIVIGNGESCKFCLEADVDEPFIAGPDKDYYEHLINNHMNDVQRKLDGYIEYDT